MRVHYPRTPHLPWSPGVASDDVRSGDLSGLVGREVVVTEKLDGENTTLYPDGLHARSLDSRHHPSRAWVKALHERIAGRIPAGHRVCGENLYARHSIAYQELDSWFYAFSVWAGERCLDWDGTVRLTRRLGMPVPPVLWRGVFDERAIRALRVDPTRQEGYVVRPVDGFDRANFGNLVAKWVRPAHVQTDVHWMLAPVLPNGRGLAAPLWDIRSGSAADPSALSVMSSILDVEPTEAMEAAVAEATARLDLIGRMGDARLAGVLATLACGPSRATPPCGRSRARLAARLVGPLGMPLARRVADLVGLAPVLCRPYPDELRPAGLRGLANAVDVGALHAVAAATLVGRAGADATAQAGAGAGTAGRGDRSLPYDQAREQVEWSMLYAEDAGLLAEAPLGRLRDGLRQALANTGTEAADRCWAHSRTAYAQGRISTAEEAIASTWRWRSGAFPRLVMTVGPAGSGKSVFTGRLAGVDEIVSLDDLRQARGGRADQRGNAAVLRAGLDRLAAALTGTRTVVWDATCLTRQQRALVTGVATRRDALVTYAVLLVDPDTLTRRNTNRTDSMPAEVLATQLNRFQPPYPDEAHRTWYVGVSGAVDDIAGSLDAEEA